MDKNFVSIIIPTYKRSDRLINAIKSVLCQTYQKLEVIVVDDNNSDDVYRVETEKRMQEFANNSRVKYIKHKKNSNGSFARNTGVMHSSGDYICFLDDDDEFYKTKVEEQLKDLLSSGFDGSCVGYELYYGTTLYKKSNFKMCSDNFLYDFLSGKVVFGAGSTMMLKRACFENLRGFDISFVRHQDWEFLLRFLRSYKFKVYSKELVKLNSDGVRNNPNPDTFYMIKKKFMNEFRNDIYKLPKSQLNDVLSYQWSETMIYYFRDRKIKKAFNIYFSEILFKTGRVQFFNLIKGLYYFLENYFSFLEKLKYKLFSK